MADETSSGNNSNKPECLQQYDVIGKIGEGTYGLVFLAKTKSNPAKSVAIKKFKKSDDEEEGVPQDAIREIKLLRETEHENIVKLISVHINHVDKSIYVVFDFAEHELYDIIWHHNEYIKKPINQYSIKSFLWQILNGLNYLHSNWIIHRDIKPTNILVMGEGEEHGVVKIADFGFARISLAPLKPLYDDGVVGTFWYRAPELLLGAKHYTSAVDIWGVGCIFAELLTLETLFPGQKAKGTPYQFQVHQLDKIFEVLGHPTAKKWPTLRNHPHWKSNTQNIQGRKYPNAALHDIVHLSPTDPAYDLLSRMLEYDPRKRIRASQALEHQYFGMEPLPGLNSLVSPQPGEEVVNYPIRRVNPNTNI